MTKRFEPVKAPDMYGKSGEHKFAPMTTSTKAWGEHVKTGTAWDKVKGDVKQVDQKFDQSPEFKKAKAPIKSPY